MAAMGRSPLVPTIAAAIACALGAAPAAAEEAARPVRVGVVVELAVNVEAARADAIGAALADALNRELRVDAFGGGDVARQLPPEGLPEECIGKPACVRDVGARLDAEQLLFLVLVSVGDDVQVDASWVEIASERVTARPRVILPSDASAVSVFANHARQYLPDAPLRRTETVIIRERPVVAPTGPAHEMTVPAWIALGTGVVALGTGAVLGVQTRGEYKDCERAQDPGCTADQRDAIARRALYTDVAFGVAAAAAITTVVLYFTSDAGEVGVAPAPGGGAVVGVSGRW